MKIGFNKPYMTGQELKYLTQAHTSGKLSGDGCFTKKCQEWLEDKTKVKKVLLTQSCTAALEMAALLIDVQPGDEIIMPSYTFVSTANAFALRGGVPVFVDIRPDTLNIDETKIEAAITPKTKAIVPVHYAGVGCEMDVIMGLAHKHQLYVIEDAAQGVMSTYKGKALGSIGHLATFSFHETKNIISGEGGALLINDEQFIEKAYLVWEKGTNRKQFFRGEVDKYTWVSLGSSFLPSELTAAFLWAQLEKAEEITRHRFYLWEKYHGSFEKLEMAGVLQRPFIPEGLQHNAHMYYFLVKDYETRARLISQLTADGINAIFHYVPLDTSPAGERYGRRHGILQVTAATADRILRLPLYIGLTNAMQQHVVNSVNKHMNPQCYSSLVEFEPRLQYV